MVWIFISQEMALMPHIIARPQRDKPAKEDTMYTTAFIFFLIGFCVVWMKYGNHP